MTGAAGPGPGTATDTIEVAVVTGDAEGAAPAVAGAVRALQAVGLTVRRNDVELGADRYLRTGELLPAAELERIRAADALLCGSPPVGRRPGIAPGLLDRGIVFALRRQLALMVNVRSFVRLRDGLEVTVVRENSEGLYFGEGTLLHAGTPHEIAVESAATSLAAATRCMRTAFELAAGRRRRVVLAHKPFVLTASGRVWTDALEEVAPEFPEVAASAENVDTCCLRLTRDAERYDVIVTDNVFGDIVSDVACGALDALAHSASAELSAGDGPSLFEPVHGPQDTATSPRVSQLSAVRAAALLARHLGHPAAARSLDRAALDVAADPPVGDVLAAVLDRCSQQKGRTK